jgi:hypothetical protein
VRNTETVKAIYEAFGRRDVAAILDKLDEAVECLIAFEAAAGGNQYSFPNSGHLWQFNAAGKVVKYDHVTDTAQMVRMAKGA